MQNQIILYNGPNSPFGRKSKVTSLIQEIDLEEKIINVYESDFLDQYNPLRKIPTLVVNDLPITERLSLQKVSFRLIYEKTYLRRMRSMNHAIKDSFSLEKIVDTANNMEEKIEIDDARVVDDDDDDIELLCFDKTGYTFLPKKSLCVNSYTLVP